MKKGLFLFLLLAAAFCPSVTVEAQNWYRGNLHMHSLWSDGGVLPEEAVSLYRDEGYNFCCLSDHNQAQDNKARWEEIGKRYSQKSLDRFQKRYPNYKLEMKTEVSPDIPRAKAEEILDRLILATEEKLVSGGSDSVPLSELDGMVKDARAKFGVETAAAVTKKFVRLKTYPEFKAEVEVPGRFLLIPGFEPSGSSKDNIQVHMNFINTESFWPYQRAENAEATLDANFAEANKLAAGREGETIYFLNHPDWIYFDIMPEWIIKRPFKFFEVINCGPTFPAHEAAWTTDKFWDIVNAFRAEDGGELLFGVASDDTHGYEPFYKEDGSATGIGGGGWIMVRANELTDKAILSAMYAGDFYASTGVDLDDVSFDKSRKTLSVKVKPADGVKYTIQFIGTKKGFDRTTTTVEDPAKDKKQARTFTVYSDEIGAVLQSTEGIQASYTMADDDLYVRAKIIADSAPARKIHGKPDHPTAWTQPVR